MKAVLCIALTCLAPGFCASTPAAAQTPTLAELAQADSRDRAGRISAGAKKEGTLTLYTTVPPANLDRLTTEFEKRHGVKVQVWRAGSDKVLARALSEARAHRRDVDALIVGAPELEALHREGLLQEVRSSAQARLVDEALPAHRAYAPVYLNLFAQAYNTNLVKRSELPRTFDDLLDPRWKGRLGIEAKNQEWFQAVVQDMGEAKGLRFFEQLVARNGISVRSGNSVLNNLVASGEVPLALTVHSYMPEQLKRKGAPIDWFVLEPAVVRANGIGIVRNAPHPNASLLFYEYMLTDGQLLLADMAYIPAMRVDPSPLSGLRLRVLDASEVLGETDRWTRLYETTLRGGAR